MTHLALIIGNGCDIDLPSKFSDFVDSVEECANYIFEYYHISENNNLIFL